MKRITLVLAFLLCALISRSQSGTISNPGMRTLIKAQIVSPTLSFKQISDTAHAYFSSLTEETETEEDEQLKENYYPWEEYWMDRCLYPGSQVGGDVAGAKALLTNALKNYNRCTTGGGPWYSGGPNSNSRYNSSYYCNIGQITAVAIDPSNSSILYAGSNHGGVFKSIDGGTTWSNKTENFNLVELNARHIEINPSNSSNVLVGTGESVFGTPGGVGIMESMDGGATWAIDPMAGTPPDDISVHAIKFDPSGGVYAGIGNQIWNRPATSTTWTMMPITNSLSPITNAYTCPACQSTCNVTNCNPCPSNCIIPGSPINPVFKITKIEYNLSTPSILYASTNIYPNYGGAKILCYNYNASSPSWTTMVLPTINNQPSTPFDGISIDVTPADPGALYIYYLNYPSGNWCCDPNAEFVIARTTDNGLTWTWNAVPYSTLNPPNNIDFLYSDSGPFEMSNITQGTFLVGGNTIFKGTLTSNNGCTYSQVTQYPTSTNTHADIRKFAIKTTGSTSEMVVVGCDGGVIQTNNFGSTWTCINGTGLNASQFYSISTFNKTLNILASPQDNWVKIWNGSEWVQKTVGSESTWSESSPINDNKVYYVEWGTIKKSTSAGQTHTVITAPSSSLGGPFGSRFYLDPTDTNIIWAGAAGNPNLYKYDASTNILQLKYTGTPGWPSIGPIAVAPSNHSVIVFGYKASSNGGPISNKLFKSTDGGQTFNDISSTANGYLYTTGSHIVFDPLNADRIFISFDNYWGPSNNPTQGTNRVMCSTNGGTSWTDMSNGLPPFSVNHLAYQNGTDDIIYAATDAGVWRYNKNLVTNNIVGTWECFNQGLPPVATRKIDINYCAKRLYVATYGRGVYFCALPQAPDFHITSSMVNTINHTTINTPTLNLPSYYNRAFANNVVVDQNVYLNQQGTLSFNHQDAFIVGKKSHVVLYGTLTTYCSQLWKGVQVEGVSSLDQSYSGGFAVNQGLLEVLFGGTIENAEVGVQTCVLLSNGGQYLPSAGGVVSCYLANFLNNRKDVVYPGYTAYSDRGKFIKCRFETTRALLNNVSLIGHVDLHATNGLLFAGNTIKYSAGSAYTGGLHGYGIAAQNCKFTVRGYCNSATPPCNLTRSTFQDLNFGVYVYNTNPVYSPIIKESDFLNNYYDGAYFRNTNYITCVNNYITVGAQGSTSSAGIYMDGCKYYDVENNEIMGSGTGYKYGILANNSGSGPHSIFRNTVDNCLMGVSAQFRNADNNDKNGVKIKCNTLGLSATNVVDVAQMGAYSNVNDVQGQPTGNSSTAYRLVGNRYGGNCGGTSPTRWYIQSPCTSKVFHVNNPDAVCMVYPQNGCSNWPVMPGFNSTYPYYASGQCGDNYPLPPIAPPPHGDPNVLIGARITNVSTQQASLNATIDGGNTQNMLNLVNGSTPESSIYTSLQNASPYLSDAVLDAYFTKTGVSNSHITDIHNRNAPVTDAVWQILVNKNLPQSVMATLTSQQNSVAISNRQYLEMEVSNAKYDLQQAYVDKIRYFLTDTINASMDTVLAVIDTANFEDSKCQLIAAQVHSPTNTLTGNAIDALHGGSGNVDSFCQFLKLAITLNSSPQGWHVLDSNLTLKAQLEAMAGNTLTAGGLAAQAPLEYIFGNSYQHPYLLPDGYSSRQSALTTNTNDNAQASQENTSIQLFNDRILELYPNPSNNILNVLLKGNYDGKADYGIEIKDLLGKIVMKRSVDVNELSQIDVTNFTNGLYVFTLLENEKTLHEAKLVIMK